MLPFCSPRAVGRLRPKTVTSAIAPSDNDGHSPVLRLSFDFGVLSQEFAVRIDLEAGLFSVRSDDDFIIPFFHWRSPEQISLAKDYISVMIAT